MTTPTTAPANLTYGTVVGRFLHIVEDSADSDTTADAIAPLGTVTFRAEADFLLDAWDDDSPATILPAPVVCTIDGTGQLVDDQGNPGVSLLATDGPTVPVDFTYQVTIAMYGTPARTFSIYLPGGTTVNLTQVQPVTSSSGKVIVPGPKGDKGDKGPKGDTGPKGPTGGANDFADKSAAFFARFGNGLVAWEDFHRDDVANFAQYMEGYSLKSGHSVLSDGPISSDSVATIVDNTQRWTNDTPGGIPIRILGTKLYQEPTMIGAQISIAPEAATGDWATATFGSNAPIGCCQVSYSQGSVQIALYKHGLILFTVQSPIIDPYPVQLKHTFDTPLVDDGVTTYDFYAYFDRANSAITVWVP